jgi:hypothetical protein
MLRLIRLVFLLALAFVSGIFWERLNEAERCSERAGIMDNGFCKEPR